MTLLHHALHHVLMHMQYHVCSMTSDPMVHVLNEWEACICLLYQ